MEEIVAFIIAVGKGGRIVTPPCCLEIQHIFITYIYASVNGIELFSTAHSTIYFWRVSRVGDKIVTGIVQSAIGFGIRE